MSDQANFSDLARQKNITGSADSRSDGLIYPSAQRSWMLVFTLFLAYTAALLDRQIVTLLIEPMKRDLKLTDSEIGLAAGLAFSLAYSAAVLPLGWLADRYSRKWLLAGGVMLWSLATASSSLAKTATSLLLLRGLTGAAESIMSPAALPMIAESFPQERRALPMGIYISGAAVGIGLALFAGGLILEATIDLPPRLLPIVGIFYPWQMTYLLAGGFGLIVVALLLFTHEPVRRRATIPGALETGKMLAYFRSHAAAYATIISTPTIFGALSFGMMFWMPAYLHRIGHVPHSSIGMTLGPIALIAGLLGPMLAAAIVQRALRNNRPAGEIHALRWLVLASGGCYGLALMVPFGLAAPLIGVALTFGNTITAIPLIVVQAVTPPPLRSRATAILTLSFAGIGFGIGPALIGLLATHLFGEALLGWAMGAFVIAATPLAILILYRGHGAVARLSLKAASFDS